MNQIIESKQIDPEQIPKGIYASAKLFFHLASTGKDYNLAHPKNRTAYCTLFIFLYSLPEFKGATEEKLINDRINELNVFISSFIEKRELLDIDLNLAKDLLAVFQELVAQGLRDRRRAH